jgi:hypothetical protein
MKSHLRGSAASREKTLLALLGTIGIATTLHAQNLPPIPTDTTNDPARVLVGRLNLESYKATIKGLTKFGDRRQGTDRNRAAVDWIEAQLRSYGCSDVQRMQYEFPPKVSREDSIARANAPRPPARDPNRSVGGGRYRGNRVRTGVNTDSLRQPDLALRKLNAQPTSPGIREQVYCTKIGSTHPEEMYIVGGHMDGHGWGEAANDDGSGSAIVLELARILNSKDVRTDRSVRFILWNNEETGLNGARAYVAQRHDLQGKESPAGSGRYPEPTWLGMIQHDMMMFDHGMPRADGSISPTQRPEADVNIEFQSTARFAAEAQRLAWYFQGANESYATDYPAQVGRHMTNTDSAPFQDLVAAITLRENERGREIGAGWDPHWHQPTDLYATFSDDDFRLGLNAAQTTLGAISVLVGTSISE